MVAESAERFLIDSLCCCIMMGVVHVRLMFVVMMVAVWILSVAVVVVAMAVMFVRVLCMIMAMMVVLLIVLISMSMTVVMRMPMTMVCMSKSSHSNNVDNKPHNADNKQFSKPLDFVALCQPLKCFIHNLNADEPSEELAFTRNGIDIA